MKKVFSFILLAALLAGCSPKSAQAEAEETMRAFFTALASGDYETAVSMYGGGYAELAQMNPDVSPTDFVTLWQRACEQNGFVCIEVMDIVLKSESDSQIDFGVTFKTKDGELFEFTGCCGETFPEPIVEYAVIVRLDKDGVYKVLALPPYVP
ncbi:MAG: lipoprotein [Chloroflexi bacterium]|nr:lipoprotein [Chloroflexota bacterium]MBI3168027.1 lipoprotein [Chloroflexota bacterium]